MTDKATAPETCSDSDCIWGNKHAGCAPWCRKHASQWAPGAIRAMARIRTDPWTLTVDIMNSFSCPVGGSYSSGTATVESAGIYVMWHGSGVSDEEADEIIKADGATSTPGEARVRCVSICTGREVEDVQGSGMLRAPPPPPADHHDWDVLTAGRDLMIEKLTTEPSSKVLYSFVFSLPRIAIGTADLLRKHFLDLTDCMGDPMVRFSAGEESYTIPTGAHAPSAAGGVHIVFDDSAGWHTALKAVVTVRRHSGDGYAVPEVAVLMSW